MKKKTIAPAYKIKDKEVAVISMFNENDNQYWLNDNMKVLLETGEEKEQSKGVHTDKELNALIGSKLKLQLASRDYALKTNKLVGNTDTQENGNSATSHLGIT